MSHLRAFDILDPIETELFKHVYFSYMLTKSDLSQIQKVMREEIEAEARLTREELLAEIKFARMQIEDEIRKVENRLKNVEIQIKKVQKDISSVINYFDRDSIKIHKRIERLEDNLGLATA